MEPVILCPACDLAHRTAPPPAAAPTQCARCGAPLQRLARSRVQTAIAFALCALVLLVLSNAYPLVQMHINGSSRQTTLAGAALGLYDQRFFALALLVFLTTIAAPFLQIVAILYLLIPGWRGTQAPGHRTVFRLLMRLRAWTFVEVFMLGTLVALVRLAKFAAIVPGVSLWCCALLMVFLSALASVTPAEQLWRWTQGRSA